MTVVGGRQKSLSTLAPGDQVMTLSATGKVVFSRMLLFLHRDQESWSTFLSLETDDGHRLAVTPQHLVFLAPHCGLDSNKYQAQFASRARIGDCLLIHTAEGQVRPSQINSVSVQESVGVYAPLTEDGTLFVEGVLASSYALVEDHWLAHCAFGPLRLIFSFQRLIWGETTVEQETADGETTSLKSPLHVCTLMTKDRAGARVNNSTPHVRDGSSKSLRMQTEEKILLSDVHWYARLLYRFGSTVLDSKSFHP